MALSVIAIGVTTTELRVTGASGGTEVTAGRCADRPKNSRPQSTAKNATRAIPAPIAAVFQENRMRLIRDGPLCFI